MKSAPRIVSLLASTALLFTSSCESTSLSNPGGSGHGGDLSLYELTGDKPNAQVSEKDIAAALGGRSGSLPRRGGKILLVQSGAHQPDGELSAAFQPLSQAVPWNGESQRTANSEKDKTAGSIGRRLRLVAAQQGCSHVVVVFGEIQSASQDLPTGSVVGWIPIVGDILPGEHSGTRLFAQALILETASPRYSIITASPREESGLTTSGGESAANVRRSLRMKKLIYPELAAKCFR
ncbi:MAG: hypothetical protein V4726_09790 [Verrucomicrobiota bacterium]